MGVGGSGGATGTGRIRPKTGQLDLKHALPPSFGRGRRILRLTPLPPAPFWGSRVAGGGPLEDPNGARFVSLGVLGGVLVAFWGSGGPKWDQDPKMIHLWRPFGRKMGAKIMHKISKTW